MVKYFQDNEVRMVFVGETENGKKTTANAILGRRLCQNVIHTYSESANRFRTHITIVHTPGLINNEDTKETFRTIQSEIGANCMHFAIFYIVYQKLTEGDSNRLNMFMEKLNSTMRRKLFLVLTDCEGVKDNPYMKSALPVIRINSTLQDNKEAECQIKELIKIIQLTESQCKTYPATLVPRFHPTRIILIIVIVLSHSARGINGDTNQVIHWKLMTKPVYFGHDVNLVCIIKTEDTSAPMAWIRIPNGETIAYNEIPTDYTKYRIGVQYDDTKMVYNYNLTIKQFNSTDVNRAYRCDFGFDSYADKLLLNDRDFTSMPSNTDVEYKFTLAEYKLTGRVKIENCFPRPMCTGIFQGKNISEFMTIQYTNVSIFFNTNIEIKYSTSICEGFVNVTCKFGDSYLHFNGHVGDCSGKSNSKPSVVLIIVGILSGVVLAFGIIFVLIAIQRRIFCCKFRPNLDSLDIFSFASYNREEGGEAEHRSNGDSDEIEPMSKQLTVQTTCDSGIGLSTPAGNKEELLRATTESEEAEDLMEECR